VIAGVWNTLFGYAAFLLLDTLFENLFEKRYAAYMLAMIIGQVLAVVSAFVLHKYFTFKSSASGINALKEFLRFSMTYTFTFAVSLGALPVLVEILHIHPRISAGIITVILAIGSFLIHSRYTFRNTAKSMDYYE
ncbi:MAG: GtrA family protein, partial [Fidelibacterota bacterium]